MNRALQGGLILLLFNLAGEVVSYFLLPIMPGSVIGMVLLFIGLQTRLIKEQWVAEVVGALMKNLPLLFLAPTVGIIALFETIKQDIIAITLSVVVSTIAVLICVGVTLQHITKDDHHNT